MTVTLIDQTISTMPTGPVRGPGGDTPTEFRTKSDLWVIGVAGLSAEFNTFRGQINVLAGEIDDLATATDEAATTATEGAVIAVASALTAVNAPGTSATSTTSLTVDDISQSFTLAQTDKAFAIGQYVNITQTSAPANSMLGKITAFTTGTGAMTVLVSSFTGSGTHTDWTISLAQSILTEASTAEMEAGTETALRTMSPEKVKEAIDANVSPSARVTKTATGTLTNGDLVSLNSDGTVSVTTGVVEATGAITQFALKAYYNGITEIGTNKVVIAYNNTSPSQEGLAVVGTVSGDVITFGTPVQFSPNDSDYIKVSKLEDDKFIISFMEAITNAGTSIIGTVSGTVPTFGAKYVFSAGGGTYIGQDIIDTDKVLIGYKAVGTQGYAIVGTISGTVISFGTATQFYGASAVDSCAVTSIGTDKALICFATTTNGYGIVAEVSGTVPTYGAEVVFQAVSAEWIDITDIEDDKALICWNNPSSEQNIAIASISGTVITYGDTTTISSAANSYQQVSNIGNVFCIQFYDSDTKVVNGTIDGDDILLNTPIEVLAGVSNENGITAIDGRFIYVVSDAGVGKYGTVTPPFTNADTFFGVSESAVTDAPATIAILGAEVTNQTGLTIAEKYYVTTLGALTTTLTDAYLVGIATGATSLIITEVLPEEAGGYRVLLSTINGAGASTIDFTGLDGTYSTYIIECGTALFSSASNDHGVIQQFEDVWVTSSFYNFGMIQKTSNNTTITGAGAASQSQIPFTNVAVNTFQNIEITASDVVNPSRIKMIKIDCVQPSPSYPQLMSTCGYYANLATPLTGLRIKAATGTITSGTFKLYGVK
jgi:hypothetical protein